MTTDQERAGARRRRHIKDARGRRVEQIDPLTMHLLRQHDVIEAEALETIVREPRLRVTRTERAFFTLALLGMSGVVGLFLYELIVQGLAGAPLAKMASLAYFAGVPWVIWYLIRRARFSQIAPILLRHRRCPHCGYDLTGLPADEEDGATVCPECACAWTLRGVATGR